MVCPPSYHPSLQATLPVHGYCTRCQCGYRTCTGPLLLGFGAAAACGASGLMLNLFKPQVPGHLLR
jgi:hypothetical protein